MLCSMRDFNGRLILPSMVSTLEALALGGHHFSAQSQNVTIDDNIVIDCEWENCPGVLRVGEIFTVLLDEYCSGAHKPDDIKKLRDFILCNNTDVASCYRKEKRYATGYTFSIEPDLPGKPPVGCPTGANCGQARSSTERPPSHPLYPFLRMPKTPTVESR